MGSLQRLPKVIVYGRTPSSLEGVYEIKYYTRQSRRRRRTEAACTSSRTWSCCKRTSLIQLSSAENLLISPLHILSLLLPCCTTVSLPCLTDLLTVSLPCHTDLITVSLPCRTDLVPVSLPCQTDLVTVLLPCHIVTFSLPCHTDIVQFLSLVTLN